MRPIFILFLLLSSSLLAQDTVFDFSNHQLDAYDQLEITNANAAIVPGGPAAPGDHALKLQGLGQGDAAAATVQLSRASYGLLAFRFKLDKKTWAGTYLRGADHAFLLHLREGHPLSCHVDGTETVPFPEVNLEQDRWYSLELFYDCAAGTFSLNLNDRHFAADLPISAKTGYVDMFRLYLYRRGQPDTIWLDDLAINSRNDLLYRPIVHVPELTAWEDLPVYSGFHSFTEKARPVPAPRSGQFQLAHDDKALQVRYQVPLAQKDALDSVEFFAQPDRQGTVYQWIVTIDKPTKHYHDGDPRDHSAALQTRQRVEEGTWFVELDIPWSSFGREGPPQTSAEWGLQVCFNDMARKQWTTWSFMGDARYYRAPARFPRAYFVPAQEGNVVASLAPHLRRSRVELLLNPEFNPGSNEAPAHAWQLADTSSIVETRQLSGDWAVQSSQPGRLASQVIGLKFPGPGPYTLKAKLSAVDGAKATAALHVTMKDGTSQTLQPLAEDSTGGYASVSRTFHFPPDTQSVDHLDLIHTGSGQLGVAMVSLSGAKVSLRVDDQAQGLRPASMRPVGDIPSTPHVPWARPLSGGPLKVLFVVAGRGRDSNGYYNNYAEERIPVEIAQRIDLDYDIIKPWEGKLYSYTSERVNRRLNEQSYDVIVSALPPTMDAYWEALLQQVQAGAGLIVTSGLPASQPLQDAATVYMQRQDIRQEHAVLGNLPLALLPHDTTYGYLREVTVGKLAGSRAVTLDIGVDRGYWMAPSGRLLYEAYRRYTWPYWEVYYSLMARAILWTGERDDTVAGLQVELADDKATVTAPAGSLRARHYDAFWNLLDDRTVATDGEPVTLPFDFRYPTGDHFVWLQLENEDGQVLAFDLLSRSSVMAGTIGDIVLPKPRYAPSETVLAEVTLQQLDGDATYTLQAILRDHRDRLVGRTVLPIDSGSGTYAVYVRPKGILGHEAKLTFLLSDDEGQVLSQARRYVSFTMDVSEKLDDFTFNFLISVLGTSVYPPHVYPTIIRMLRDDLGINCFLSTGGAGINGLQIPLEGDLLSQFWGYQTKFSNRGYRGHIFTDNPKVEGHTRNPCLHDPATLATIERAYSNFATDMAIVNPAMLVIEDETALVLSHPTLDLCDSPHTLAAYRQWLPGIFPTVDAMNDAWGTTYASYDEPGLITGETARQRDNPAEFVTFRRFMDHTFTDRSGQVADIVRRQLPHCQVGYENTRNMRWYSGWNIGAIGQRLQVLGTYGNDTGPDIFGSYKYFYAREMTRSLAPHTKQMGWFGYGAEEDKLNWLPWYWTLHGAGGISLYYFGHPKHSYFLADLRRTESWPVVKEALAPFRQGIGRQLQNLERTAPRIGIYYSQASLAMAWAQSGTEDKNSCRPEHAQGAFLSGIEHWRRLIEDAGYQWDFLTPEQIEQGALADYRVVILPSAPVVGAGDREALAAFANSGGTVIAGPNSAVADAHGKPQDDSWLQAVFGLQRDWIRQPAYTAKPLTWDGKEFELHGGDTLRPMAGTTVSLHYSDGELAMTRRNNAIFVNAVPPPYLVDSPAFQVWSDWFGAVLSEAGLRPWADLTRADGERPHGVELVQYSNGPARVLGVLHDYRFPAEKAPLNLTFPEPWTLVDMRSGEVLGTGTSFTLDLPYAQARLLALLPRSPDPMISSPPPPSQAGDVVPITIHGFGLPLSIVHAEVTDPTGQAYPHYAANVRLEQGQGELRIPTALNDPTGQWQVELRNIMTGQTASVSFHLLPPE